MDTTKSVIGPLNEPGIRYLKQTKGLFSNWSPGLSVKTPQMSV